MITFVPTCTLPTGPSLVQDPDIRSTWDILRSSFAVIFLCTWSILRLNVPAQLRDEQHSNRWRRYLTKLGRTLYEVQRKAKWTIMTMLLPELVLGCALESYLGARESARAINEAMQREGSESKWTLTHSMYANMGGFVIRFPSPPAPSPPPADERQPEEGNKGGAVRKWLDDFAHHNKRYHRLRGHLDWDVHPAHCALAQTLLSSVPPTNPRANEHKVLPHRLGLISLPFTLAASEIHDKSKDDALVKTVAMLKVGLLAVDLARRAAARIPASQVEVMALAFACCALFSYPVLLPQPQGVGVPTVIHAKRSAASLEEMERISRRGYLVLGGRPGEYAIPDFTAAMQPGAGFVTSVGTGVALVVFGAVHLAAWDLAFPSVLERLLWRVSAVLVTGLPLCWLLLLVGMKTVAGWEVFETRSGTGKKVFRRDWGSKLFLVVTLVVVVIYKVPRVYLIVEAVRSTYYLPPKAYAATWTSGFFRLG
ncbi:hypothetical protein QBC47DRAFT_397603 [Echria macrotheca]|uniref:Uncharacterized protein n=1 Tax=Echria macrotheca TaxID=438768 RepID=A0AAJ0BMS2_9PEZI|nr:hypothetical protein QBC47DRAFT_397603 [Echria macrotheca]